MRKKICCVIQSLQCGGAERVMSELVNRFAEGNEVYLILLHRCERFYSVDKRVVIIEPEFEIGDTNRLLYAIKLIPFFRRSIKRISPNAVMSFGRAYNPFVLLSCLGLDYPIFVSDRGNPHYNSGLINEFMRRYLYRYKAKGIISQTKYSEQVVKNTLKCRNVNVIGNPIRSIVHEGEIQAREKRIVFVGRLVVGKGVNYLIEAFSKLSNNDWVLDIVGDGPMRESLESLSHKYSVEQRVNFVGRVSNVEFYLNRAEIFVFPSLSEGFPNGLAEAMVSGLACVSFDCVTGPSDLIDDGVNGFLIPVGNGDLLAERISGLIEDVDTRKMIQRNAVKVGAKYSLDIISAEYFNFITGNVRGN